MLLISALRKWDKLPVGAVKIYRVLGNAAGRLIDHTRREAEATGEARRARRICEAEPKTSYRSLKHEVRPVGICWTRQLSRAIQGQRGIFWRDNAWNDRG
jgi:hypothetical protein